MQRPVMVSNFTEKQAQSSLYSNKQTWQPCKQHCTHFMLEKGQVCLLGICHILL